MTLLAESPPAPTAVHSLAGRPMSHLSFFEGDQPLFVHLLRPGRTVLGRSDRCDVALPSDSVSRVHCFVERRADGWWVTDRSRNGTLINGQSVERHALVEGDRITLGAYTALFQARPDRGDAERTTRKVRPAWHEELVEVGEGRVTATHARLRFTQGPRAAEIVVLKRALISLGGPGSDTLLARDLPPSLALLRVTRGRVMIEPGAGPVVLAGARVRDLTPVYPGEEVRVGEHAFVLELQTVEEEEEDASFGALAGRAPVMLRLFGVLGRMAAHDAPVLLLGEKSLFRKTRNHLRRRRCRRPDRQAPRGSRSTAARRRVQPPRQVHPRPGGALRHRACPRCPGVRLGAPRQLLPRSAGLLAGGRAPGWLHACA